MLIVSGLARLYMSPYGPSGGCGELGHPVAQIMFSVAEGARWSGGPAQALYRNPPMRQFQVMILNSPPPGRGPGFLWLRPDHHAGFRE
jgi:hypothetical protein